MAGADGWFRSATLPVFLLSALLSACASSGPQPLPRIDRLPESVDSHPGSPPLNKDRLVDLARAGTKPDDVVERWRGDGARLKLNAADIVDLDKRGVPLPVLDALLGAQEQALRTDLDTRLLTQLANRQAEFSAQLAVERARSLNCPNPAYWGYGGWGWPGTWRGGFDRGW